MHMVSKKDLHSAELDHEDIKKSDGDDGQREVQAREEATVHVNNWIYS